MEYSVASTDLLMINETLNVNLQRLERRSLIVVVHAILKPLAMVKEQVSSVVLV